MLIFNMSIFDVLIFVEAYDTFLSTFVSSLETEAPHYNINVL